MTQFNFNDENTVPINKVNSMTAFIPKRPFEQNNFNNTPSNLNSMAAFMPSEQNNHNNIPSNLNSMAAFMPNSECASIENAGPNQSSLSMWGELSILLQIGDHYILSDALELSPAMGEIEIILDSF